MGQFQAIVSALATAVAGAAASKAMAPDSPKAITTTSPVAKETNVLDSNKDRTSKLRGIMSTIRARQTNPNIMTPTLSGKTLLGQ